MANYRILIESANPTAEAQVQLTYHLQTDASGAWENAFPQPETITFNGHEIAEITSDPNTTDQGKRQSLLTLFIRKTRARHTATTHQAYNKLCDLLPNGFPVTVSVP
jgi:hypothetical protein